MRFVVLSFLFILTFLNNAFAINVKDSSLCTYRGNALIQDQKMLVEQYKESVNADKSLVLFFNENIEALIENLEVICNGKATKGKKIKNYRLEQLKLIKQGLESGEIDAELAEFFLSNLK